MVSRIIIGVALPLGSILAAAVVLTIIDALLVTNLAQKAMAKVFSHLHVGLRWLLIVILFSTLAFITRPLRDLVTTPFNPPAAAHDPKDSLDELKWMLTVLAGFAVIISIAQAAAAWVSALTYDKQATAKLKEIEANAETSRTLAAAKLQDIEKVLESVKARYPVFYEVEKKRNDAHDELIAALRRVFSLPDEVADPTEAINYMKDIYNGLNVETRQLVLSVESFASVDLHPPLRGTPVDNLKLFAVFYHAKYRYEETLRGKEEKLKGTVSLGDLERAEGYLLQALKQAQPQQKFTLLNELANVYFTAGKSVGEDVPPGYPNFIDQAKAKFEESLGLRAEQQRANYNLAVIMAKYKKNYARAVQLLEAALKCKNWQNAATPADLAAYVQYNLGCYVAQNLTRDAAIQGPISKTQAQAALDYLAKGLGTGMILLKDVKKDYDQDGDIWVLHQRADDELKSALDAIRPQL